MKRRSQQYLVFKTGETDNEIEVVGSGSVSSFACCGSDSSTVASASDFSIFICGSDSSTFVAPFLGVGLINKSFVSRLVS